MPSAMEHIVNPPVVRLIDDEPKRKAPPPNKERNEALLAEARERLGVVSDRQLALELNVNPSTISKLRSGSINLGAGMAIRIHEVAGISFPEIRQILKLAEDDPIASDDSPMPPPQEERL
jgi:transcriptional regulator with XRE-family HTH domain